jgi:predicted N-acetyltransferase YhbS
MNRLEEISFRLENIDDYRRVEELTREAFWDLYRPGCEEHLMVHQLRKSQAYIPELDMIACDGEAIVGHILYSRSFVINEAGQSHEVISFGPLSVLPEYQNKGIGSALIEKTKAMAKEQGYKGIFIYGNPAYYHRFGFVNAIEFQITTPNGDNFEDFMGLALSENSLDGIHGKLYEDIAFNIDKAKLEYFDSTFPFKEKKHSAITK